MNSLEFLYKYVYLYYSNSYTISLTKIKFRFMKFIENNKIIINIKLNKFYYTNKFKNKIYI